MEVARSIFVIFLILIVCFVPVTVVHYINKPDIMPRTFLAMHILYWVQYCLNIVAYVLANRQYRLALFALFAKILPSWEKHKAIRFPWESQRHSVITVSNQFDVVPRLNIENP